MKSEYNTRYQYRIIHSKLMLVKFQSSHRLIIIFEYSDLSFSVRLKFDEYIHFHMIEYNIPLLVVQNFIFVYKFLSWTFIRKVKVTLDEICPCKNYLNMSIKTIGLQVIWLVVFNHDEKENITEVSYY